MHKTDTPAQQRDWQSVVNANRQLDEAVAAIENAVWRAPPPAIREARPTPVQPVAAPVTSPAPAPTFASRPAAGFPMTLVFPPRPASPLPPAPAPEPVAEDIGNIAQALEAEGAELRRQRAALLEGAVFVLPWNPTPRPVLAADATPHQVTDDELRDVIQPHWRALIAQAAAAAAQLAATRENENGKSAWRRLLASRATLTAAEQADAAARQAVETAELIWKSGSLGERFAQMRTIADQAVREAAAAVTGVTGLDQAIAANDAALALAAELRGRGVCAIERRHDETPAQALARAGAP